MLTQSVSKVPANLWAIYLALDLEDREFFSEAFDELRVGVGRTFRLPQSGSVVLGLSLKSIRILMDITKSLIVCGQDARSEGPIPLARSFRVNVWSTRLPVTRQRRVFIVG